jgi:hypothetical protein
MINGQWVAYLPVPRALFSAELGNKPAFISLGSAPVGMNHIYLQFVAAVLKCGN